MFLFFLVIVSESCSEIPILGAETVFLYPLEVEGELTASVINAASW